MGREHVALIQYASPAVVPKCLQIVAAINYSGGTPPNGMRQVSSHWYNPGEAIPGRYRRVGAVTYAIGAARPNGLVTVAAMEPDLVLEGLIMAPFTAANTPAVGAELLTNGNMETGNPPTAWVAGGGATLAGAADERTGGAGAQSLSITNGATNYGLAASTGTSTAGIWYRLTGWLKKVTADINLRLNNSSISMTLTSAGTWTSVTGTGRATDVGSVVAENQNNTLGLAARADDVSLKALTLSSLLDLKADASPNGVFGGAVTVAAGLQGGIAAVDSNTAPANGWFAYHDGTNAKLDKLVAGTWTSVISAAAAYSAGATIRVERSGTSFSLYYNGTQVGSTSAINDLPALTQFGAFRTDTTVTVSEVTHRA